MGNERESVTILARPMKDKCDCNAHNQSECACGWWDEQVRLREYEIYNNAIEDAAIRAERRVTKSGDEIADEIRALKKGAKR